MSEIKKKIKYCPNGHPFDPSRYDSCPHCVKGSFAPTLDPFDQSNRSNNSRMNGTVDPLYNRDRSHGYDNHQHSEGRTFDPTEPPDNMQRREMNKTLSIDENTPDGAPSPVVGWLVALNGPYRGADYRIRVGYNYIGRTYGDIRIQGDPTISAEKDSSVAYFPKTRKFYICRELGKNPLMHNDEGVMREAELKSHDRVTIGKTDLIFIPLSGEHFDWSEG